MRIFLPVNFVIIGAVRAIRELNAMFAEGTLDTSVAEYVISQNMEKLPVKFVFISVAARDRVQLLLT